jgi:TM2 domain-containing membrane protein YozV
MLVSQEAHRSKLICFLFVPVICFLVDVVTCVEEGAEETLVETLGKTVGGTLG